MFLSGESSRGGGRWLQQLSWGSLLLLGGSWVLQGERSSAPLAKPALLCSGAVCSGVDCALWQVLSRDGAVLSPPSSSIAPAGTGRWWQQEQLCAGSAVAPLSTLDPTPALFIYV